MHREIKQLLKFIALKYDIPFSEVQKVYEAPFKLQVDIMKVKCDRKSANFPSLRIPYFGVFYSPKWRRDKYFKKNNENI